MLKDLIKKKKRGLVRDDCTSERHFFVIFFFFYTIKTRTYSCSTFHVIHTEDKTNTTNTTNKNKQNKKTNNKKNFFPFSCDLDTIKKHSHVPGGARAKTKKKYTKTRKMNILHAANSPHVF